MATRKLTVKDIYVDPEIMPRAEINRELVEEFKEIMRRLPMPAIDVMVIEGKYWLWDGLTRLTAAKELNLPDILADVLPKGNKPQLTWLAAGANAKHGQRLSNPDKRRAVELALSTPEGQKATAEAVADHVGVSAALVHKVKQSIAARTRNPKPKLAEVVQREPGEDPVEEPEEYSEPPKLRVVSGRPERVVILRDLEDGPNEGEGYDVEDWSGEDEPLIRFGGQKLWLQPDDWEDADAPDEPEPDTAFAPEPKEKKTRKPGAGRPHKALKAAQAEKQLKDAVGNVVPEFCRKAAEETVVVRELQTEFSKLMKRVEHAANLPSGAGANIDTEYILNFVNEIRKSIDSATMHAVCPDCAARGKVTKNCQCDGVGWLTRDQYNKSILNFAG